MLKLKDGLIVIGLFAASAAALGTADRLADRELSADVIRRAPREGTRVARVRPIDGATGVLPNASIALDLAFERVVPGHDDAQGIDPRTLENGVRLLDDQGQVVPAHVNTSGAGDSIVLTPARPLRPGADYRFATGPELADEAGRPVEPFSSRFTVAKSSRTVQIDVAFEKVTLAVESGSAFTCVVVGPDRRLYAATYDGRILQFDLAADGVPTLRQTIDTVVRQNAGPRTVIGLAFDPQDASTVWITHGQMMPFIKGVVRGADDWTGKLSVLDGKDFSRCRDALVGLPRAFKDHLTFQPAFGPDGAIYFGQGSNTSTGAADAKWNMRPERRLTAAMLRFDPRDDSKWPIDVRTQDGGSYDPSSPGAPLTIFATGVRSAYDTLWHSNGHLYTGVNGAAAGGATPAIPPRDGRPGVAAIDPLDLTGDDMLLDVRPGAYYGAPNPSRGEFVLAGGNPTEGIDPCEVPLYPVGTTPEHDWSPPAFNLGKSVSPNGLAEYHAPADGFGAAIDRAILITRYSAGDDIIALLLDKDGAVLAEMSGIEGFGGFKDPLDLAEDPATGNLYVAEFGGQRITLLRPKRGASSRAYVRLGE